MATIDNYTIDIKVKGDQDIKSTALSVEKLGGQVKNLGESFEKASGKAESLAIAIAGLGISEYIHSILEASSKTKDLSEAYGVTIENVLELEKGFAKAGRGADDMSKMMTVLNMKALEVADGNLSALSSFEDLGISFQDLKSMSMDEIFLKIAKAMEEGHGSAKTIAAAMDVLGKGAKGVPWGDFIEGMEKARGRMGDNAKAVETLDKTMKNLEASAGAIKREFTLLIAPLAETFNKFTEGSDNAKAAAVGLGAAMAVISGAIAAKGIMMVVETFKEFAIMTGISSAATSVETAALAANTAATAANATAKSASIAAKIASLEASIAEAAATLRGEATMMTEAAARNVLERMTWRLAVAKGAAAEATAIETAAVSASAAALTTEAAAATTAATATTAFGTAVGFVMKNLGPISIALTAITAAWAAWDYLSASNKAAEKVNEDVDATEKDVAAKKALLDEETKLKVATAAQVEALRNQYQQQDLNLQISQERLRVQLATIGLSEVEKAKRIALFDEESKRLQEITKLENEISRMRIAAANEKDGDKKYAGQIQVLEEQLEITKRQKNITTELTVEIKKAEQAEASRLAMMNIQNKVADELFKVQGEMNQLTMTGDEQKIANLRQQIEMEGILEVRRREALLGAGQTLPEQEKLKVMDQVRQKYDPLIEAQRRLNEESRSFSVGWEKAFNDYVDNATNAANKAKNMFDAVTSNMNSAIDNFVDNGKFSFSDLASSMIRDMIKIELKASAMQLWKMMGSGSGGGFLSMLGFAEGGDPPTGKPSIVGENGPEVFIPKNPGTILNQDQLASLGAGAQKQEQQAPVYNITNNISAVDAQGVARLFANNRQMLLGTIEQARKESPSMGR